MATTSFWNIFQKSNFKNNLNHGSLYDEIKSVLPDATENDCIEVACFTGLLARVAFADLNIEESEVQVMQKALTDWSDLPKNKVDTIVHLAAKVTEELAGLENYKYTAPLLKSLSEVQRYKILESLFAVAVSDGNADSNESEEIRTISQGLGLTHHHYVSAKSAILHGKENE